MGYCSIMDVRRRIPEVTSDVVSDADLKDFIEEADAYIDDALREIYDVPFTTAPTAIEKLSSMWASYIAQTLYPDARVEEDLVRLRVDIDNTINDYVSGKKTLGSSYEIDNPISESFYYSTTKTKYGYYEVDQ